MKNFEAVIGLEVHSQLITQRKIFASSACLFKEEPNTFIDPVTLALPGSLPVLNKSAIEQCIKLGLALQCKIQEKSIFARKHYFYPDLPKGYQISQYDMPLCSSGLLDIPIYENEEIIGTKKIRITRIHLEEDAGKSIHLDYENSSLVDLNRAGTTLAEIVSEPDLRSAKEASEYMKKLRQIVRYLGVSDGNMEEGNLRCDANISIREYGAKEYGTKVEIKNLNSFKHVEKAINHEINRQINLITHNQNIIQETRLWDDITSTTKSMRTKEEASDYRYFPDPDLLPVIIDSNWIEKIQNTIPELPEEVKNRLIEDLKLDSQVADFIAEDKDIVTFFDLALSEHNSPIVIANWICNELFGKLNKKGVNISESPISPKNLAELIRLIENNTVSGKMAKSIFEEMFDTSKSPEIIVEEKGLKQITDSKEIEKIIDEIIAKNPDQIEQYKAGKTKVLGFLVGLIMKETKGKANPQIVNEIILSKLK